VKSVKTGQKDYDGGVKQKQKDYDGGNKKGDAKKDKKKCDVKKESDKPNGYGSGYWNQEYNGCVQRGSSTWLIFKVSCG
jgi:hypothetical protein